MAEWQNAEWQDGSMAECKNGGIAEWNRPAIGVNPLSFPGFLTRKWKGGELTTVFL